MTSHGAMLGGAARGTHQNGAALDGAAAGVVGTSTRGSEVSARAPHGSASAIRQL